MSVNSCNEEHNICERIIILFRKRVLQNLASVVILLNFFDKSSVENWDAVTCLSEIALHGKGCNGRLALGLSLGWQMQHKSLPHTLLL